MAIIRVDNPIVSLRSPELAPLLQTEQRVRAVRRAAAAVARLHFDPTPAADRAGTGFLVGDRLAIVARYSAQAFVDGVGDRGLVLRKEARARLDFGVVEGEGPVIEIRDVRFVHPYFDLALVELAANPDAEPLVLEATLPLQLIDRQVVTLGFPAADPRASAELVRQVMSTQAREKMAQPGRIQGLSHYLHHGLPRVSLAHDCSTLGGSSGSPVLEPVSGRVVGIHFAGTPGHANFAVPSWELARDVRVREARVSFSEPLCPWATQWDARVALPEAAPGLYVRQEGNLFTTYKDGRKQEEVKYDGGHVRVLSRLFLQIFQPIRDAKEFLVNGPTPDLDPTELNWEGVPATVAEHLVDKLQARKMLTPEFFAALARRAGLHAIAVRWNEAAWLTDEVAGGAAPPAIAPAADSGEAQIRAEAAQASCGCHAWPATLDPKRRRIVPVATLAEAAARSAGVVQVHLSDRDKEPETHTRGLRVTNSPFNVTGFLLAPDLVLTGAPALRDQAGDRRRATIWLGGPAWVGVDEERILVDEEVGWALLPLTRPVLDRPPLTVRATPVEVGEPLSLLYYHRGASTLYASIGDTAALEVSPEALRMVISQGQGTFGCPIVDSNFEVVGQQLQSTPSSDGLHTVRCWVGVPIRRILDALAERGVVVPSASPPTPDPVPSSPGQE